MKLTLKSDQKEHVKKLTDILAKNYSCLDLSQMGSGKTFTMEGNEREFDATQAPDENSTGII